MASIKADEVSAVCLSCLDFFEFKDDLNLDFPERQGLYKKFAKFAREYLMISLKALHRFNSVVGDKGKWPVFCDGCENTVLVVCNLFDGLNEVKKQLAGNIAKFGGCFNRAEAEGMKSLAKKMDGGEWGLQELRKHVAVKCALKSNYLNPIVNVEVEGNQGEQRQQLPPPPKLQRAKVGKMPSLIRRIDLTPILPRPTTPNQTYSKSTSMMNTTTHVESTEKMVGDLLGKIPVDVEVSEATDVDFDEEQKPHFEGPKSESSPDPYEETQDWSVYEGQTEEFGQGSMPLEVTIEEKDGDIADYSSSDLMSSGLQIVSVSGSDVNSRLIKKQTKRKKCDDDSTFQLNLDHFLPDMVDFVKFFKRRRQEFGFTQADVTKLLGFSFGLNDELFSQTTVSRFEAMNLTRANMAKLRPVFEKFLKEYCEEQPTVPDAGEMKDFPNLKRKKRTKIEGKVFEMLEHYFKENRTPNGDEINWLAQQTGADREVVRVWFCNRRQKIRKILRSSPVPVVVEHHRPATTNQIRNILLSLSNSNPICPK